MYEELPNYPYPVPMLLKTMWFGLQPVGRGSLHHYHGLKMQDIWCDFQLWNPRNPVLIIALGQVVQTNPKGLAQKIAEALKKTCGVICEQARL
jgi:hypothetical protein